MGFVHVGRSVLRQSDDDCQWRKVMFTNNQTDVAVFDRCRIYRNPFTFLGYRPKNVGVAGSTNNHSANSYWTSFFLPSRSLIVGRLTDLPMSFSCAFA